MHFTRTRVRRGAVLPDANGTLVYHQLVLPLARCDTCPGRFRVLPVELLPRKTYGLAPIERHLAGYLPGGPGLRKVVQTQAGETPHPSTLWHWLEDLGHRLQERTPPADPSGPRTAALVEETARRLDPELSAHWLETPEIDPGKYRSAARGERLLACFRLVRAAARLFAEATDPLVAWAGFLVRTFRVSALAFSSRDGCTAIQHRPRPTARVACPRHAPPGRAPP